MVKPKQSAIARVERTAAARETLENRHERIKRSLRDEIAQKNAQLEDFHAEITSIKQKIADHLSQNSLIRSEINVKKQLIDNYKEELSLKSKQIEKYGLEINHVRRENLQIKDKLESSRVKLEKLSNIETTMAARELENTKNEKKLVKLETQLNGRMSSTPISKRKLKSFDSLGSEDGKKNRCKLILQTIRNLVGEPCLDDFLSYFCRFVAKDSQFSFHLKLSDVDSFFATTHWKLSDSFLREFKGFLNNRLGFDVFGSRENIRALRDRYSNLEQYNITLKPIVRTIGSKEIETTTAVIEAKDVKIMIKTRLERLHANGRLRLQEDGHITLGFGGDKGGRHVKVIVSLGNVDHPNNPHSILLVGMYEGEDSYDSLKENLLSVFDMMNNLKEISYMEGSTEVTRKVVIYPIGDCKYTSSVLGHPGQSSSRPCFLCDLKWVNHGQHAALLSSFDISRCGNPHCPSGMKEPLLLADPDTIGPPGIHVILGIAQSYCINWLFALCNSIDNPGDLPEDLKRQAKVLRNLQDELEVYSVRLNSSQVAVETVEKMIEVVENASKPGRRQMNHHDSCEASFCIVGASKKSHFSAPQIFSCHSCHKTIHSACSLILESEDLLDLNTEECVECQYSADITLQDRLQLLLDLKQKLSSQLKNDEELYEDVAKEYEHLEACLKKSNGPTRKKLENVLKSIGCDLRAWYQQLTGNQVQRLLRDDSISAIFAVFPDDCSQNLPLMKEVMQDLGKLMSSANNEYKTDEQIDQIDVIVKRFLANLTEAQPMATATPKLHLLCAHLVPFLRVHRSWGHLTEQGLESLHAVINALIIRFASVRNVEKNAQLMIKHMSNFNFIFDFGQSWFKNF